MKVCLLMRVEDGSVTELAEMSLVGDDHQFGLSADGKFLHYEGGVFSSVPAANGGVHVAVRVPFPQNSDE